MILIFTKSKIPNFFSRAIAFFQDSPWTHVCINTEFLLPNKDYLGIQSQWNTGVMLAPLSLMTKGKIIRTYKIGEPLNWARVPVEISRFGGAEKYAWAQYLGHILRFVKIKEPEWLTKYYRKQTYCSELVLMELQRQSILLELDPNKTGPGDLERAVSHMAIPIFEGDG